MKILAPAWLTLSILLTSCAQIPVASTTKSTVVPVIRTPSSTPLPPIAYVGGSVPCYADATVDADILATVEIGDGLEIIGEARFGEYWVVQPDGINGYCWLESEFVTVDGDPGRVPHIIPTPLPSPQVPGNFTGESECRIPKKSSFQSSAVFAILAWDDVDGETGYRIYKYGEMIAELPRDQTQYEGIIESMQSVYFAGAAVFALEAFNESGTSDQVEIVIDFACSIHPK